jgi:hypothetical protein
VIYAFCFSRLLEELLNESGLFYTPRCLASQDYSIRALVEGQDELDCLTRDLEDKLNTSEALDELRSLFGQTESADSLDEDEKDVDHALQ